MYISDLKVGGKVHLALAVMLLYAFCESVHRISLHKIELAAGRSEAYLLTYFTFRSNWQIPMRGNTPMGWVEAVLKDGVLEDSLRCR